MRKDFQYVGANDSDVKAYRLLPPLIALVNSVVPNIVF